MKHIFILNPVAGKGRGKAYVPLIEAYFKNRSEPFEILYTKGPGDATLLAAIHSSKEEPCRIYSIGGDGTLNEVLNGLVGTSTALGVLPSGSGNDFFRNLEETPGVDLLARTIEGKNRTMDLGVVNDQYFLNVASVGIDAAIVWNARKFKTLPFLSGMAAYVAGIFYTVFSYRSFPSQVYSKDQSLEEETLLMAVANGFCYGGGMNIAPGAKVDSGCFEIYHIHQVSPFKILFLFPKLIQGRHEALKEVRHFSSREVTIRSKDSFLLNRDGEVERVTEAHFTLLPGGITIIQPLPQKKEA